MPAFENLRVNPFQSDRTKSVAWVSCKINTELGGLYLNDMTLVNGNNGLFLSFPSRKMPKPDAQGREYKNFYFMDREFRESLQQAAIDEYQRRVGEGAGNGGGGGSFAGGGYGGGGNYGGPSAGSGQAPARDGAGNSMQTPYGNPPANDDDIPF